MVMVSYVVLLSGHLRSLLQFGTFYTLRDHVILPLDERGSVVSVVCADKSDKADKAELERRVWPELKTRRATFTDQISQTARRAHCAREALALEASGARPFSHFVHCRPDVVFARPLAVVSRAAITTRARSVSGVGAVDGDALTSGGCGPCDGFFGSTASANDGHPCLLLTDQFAVVPRTFVRAYFGATPPPLPPRPGLGGLVDALAGGGPRSGGDDCPLELALDASTLERCPCATMYAEGALTRRVAAAAPRICLAPLRYDLDDRRSRDMSLRRYESKRRRIPRGAWEVKRNVSC